MKTKLITIAVVIVVLLLSFVASSVALAKKMREQSTPDQIEVSIVSPSGEMLEHFMNPEDFEGINSKYEIQEFKEIQLRLRIREDGTIESLVGKGTLRGALEE